MAQETRKGVLTALVRGLMAAIAVTLIGMLILASLVVWADLSDSALEMLNQGLKLLAVAAGVYAAVRRGGERGLAKGACVGLLYIALGYGACALLGEMLVTPGMLALEMAMGLAAGALCGALCANLRPPRRRTGPA